MTDNYYAKRAKKFRDPFLSVTISNERGEILHEITHSSCTGYAKSRELIDELKKLYQNLEKETE